mmetsp:Transcript_35734/g.81993  ORF Transcript_35734/g.81993 Transcript_35734/m.81993 type:complete len:499 (-) Transcript_35734:156-1652(-)
MPQKKPAAAAARSRLLSKVTSKMLTKGRIDRSEVKKSTVMTREEWKELQKGMDAKWPLPDYMQGEKGHMQFKDETYSTVTRWTADTKIKYRPHAKSPGSKSHLRYESYSVAKTVGEALALHCYPADWCWDYERGFLKVVGGHIRDEPVDIGKVPEGKVTDVDRKIHAWYKKELAKKIGIKESELSGSVAAGESLHMRGTRLLAQKEARERLEAADKAGRKITDEDVLQTLQRWNFAKNVWRQNVAPDGQDWVFSDTLGLLRDRQGDVHLTAPTRRYPQVAELIARWLTDRLPPETKDFKFTSMNLNYNYAAKQHRDNGNFGPSFIRAFGDFTGGELNYWPEDNGGPIDKLPQNKKHPLDISDGIVLFNGNCAHSVADFDGERYSVVFFTIGSHAVLPAEDREKMLQLGIPMPSGNEDPFAYLREPRGYAASAKNVASPNNPRRGAAPPYRQWTSQQLPSKVKKTVSKRKRFEPENAKSFYGYEARRLRRYGTTEKLTK